MPQTKPSSSNMNPNPPIRVGLLIMALLAPGALAITETGAGHTLGTRTPRASGRQLRQQQVIGCVSCGNNNGNNNGAQVRVSQQATQTSGGGGGGGGGGLFPFLPFPFGHKRLLKQQQVIGCITCGNNNGNNNGAVVIVDQKTTQTSEGGGGGGNPFPISFPITLPFRGHRRMLKQCVDNFPSCQSWGRSQCMMPGVPDKCPCMCTGSGAPGTQPVGPPIQVIACVSCGNGNGNGNGK